jgi:hypothetical protein
MECVEKQPRSKHSINVRTMLCAKETQKVSTSTNYYGHSIKDFQE